MASPDDKHDLLSEERCERFRQHYLGAEATSGGQFLIGDMGVPPGERKTWAYDMSHCDCSGLVEQAAGCFDVIDRTVVDQSRYERRDGEGKLKASFRTVSLYATAGDHRELVSIRRQNDQKSDGAENLAGSALGDYLALAEARGVELAGKPLVSLAPELADPDERRLLVAERIPYAIQLEHHEPFKDVVRPLDEDIDVQDQIHVGRIFDVYEPQRDCAATNVMEVRDLHERKKGTRMIREFLFECPGDGGTAYFLVWPALPPAQAAERLRAASAMAAAAVDLMRRPPGARLRLHEFHHPHERPYRTAVRIAAAGRGW